jgi:hypothetical protein
MALFRWQMEVAEAICAKLELEETEAEHRTSLTNPLPQRGAIWASAAELQLEVQHEPTERKLLQLGDAARAWAAGRTGVGVGAASGCGHNSSILAKAMDGNSDRQRPYRLPLVRARRMDALEMVRRGKLSSVPSR